VSLQWDAVSAAISGFRGIWTMYKQMEAVSVNRI
jgi:hypothetical protein